MKKFVLFAVICVLALSCKQEGTLTATSDIPSIKFGPEGGTFNPILFTNGSSWTATCDDPAVTFSPASGSFTTPLHIEVGENTEHFTKAIRIAVVSYLDESSRTFNFVVTQTCWPFVLCNDHTKTIGAEGGKLFFTINSNNGWFRYRVLLDGEDTGMYYSGLTMVPSSCVEPNDKVTTVTVPANDTGRSRTWTLLLGIDKEEEACRLTIVQD